MTERAWNISKFFRHVPNSISDLSASLRGGLALKVSRLFDREWFQARYPAVERSELSAERYFLKNAIVKDLDPNPLFDTSWYLERYPDVAEAGVNPLIHFIKVGWREGRDPHPAFSVNQYLLDHPDVAIAEINPLTHYLCWGKAEGRRTVSIEGATNTTFEAKDLSLLTAKLDRCLNKLCWPVSGLDSASLPSQVDYLEIIGIIGELESLSPPVARQYRLKVITKLFSWVKDIGSLVNFDSRTGKIGYITSSSIPSRAANNVHVIKMCNALCRAGLDLELFFPDAGGSDRSETRSFIEGIGGGSTLAYSPVAQVAGSLAADWAMIGRALEHGCNHFLTRSLGAGYLLAGAERKVVLELHRPLGDYEVPQAEQLFAMPSFLGLSGITRALAVWYEARFPQLEGMITVLPDAADPIDVEFKFELTDRKRFKTHVGYAGQLYEGRGIELIMSLAAAMPEVAFHIVGGNDDDIELWQNRARAFHNLIFYGYRSHSEVQAFISAVDFLLAPYQHQVRVYGNSGDTARWMSPLKIFEYMAAGKPIISSNLPVLCEVLEDGHNAILCDPESDLEWQAAIERLVADRDLCSTLAQNARREFHQSYTWSHRAKRISEIMFKSDRFAESEQNPVLDFQGVGEQVYSERSSGAQPKICWVFPISHLDGAYGVNAVRISSLMTGFEHILGVGDRSSKIVCDVAIFFDLIAFEEWGERIDAPVKILRVGGPSPMQDYSRGDRDRLRGAFGNFDAVIAVSPELARESAKYHPRVYCVPNGIDLVEWSPDQLLPPPTTNSLVIGMAAKLVSPHHQEQKGYHLAVEAAQMVGEELMVVGRGIKEIPAADMIEKFYSKIDVLIHPVGPGKEGSSNVIMEALALGIPVLTTRYAGFHGERLESHLNALLVERTPFDFARAIALLVSDSKLRSSLSKAARAFAESNHDLTEVSSQYHGIVMTLLDEIQQLRLTQQPGDLDYPIAFNGFVQHGRDNGRYFVAQKETEYSRLVAMAESAPLIGRVSGSFGSVLWVCGASLADSSKRFDWAYGINARRLSARIKSFEHHLRAFADDVPKEATVKLSFDILIHQKPQTKAIRSLASIVRVGGPTPLKQIGDGSREALKTAFSDVDAVIALSPALRDRVLEFHNQVYFIPNGIELDKFNPAQIASSLAPRPFRAGMAASLKTRDQKDVKGYHVAQAACRQLGIELLVVGRGVNQVAPDKMIQDFYSQIDVLIHPVGPGKEGSSNVIMEALALGIPVITTPFAGFHGEYLQSEEEALIVERYPRKIAEALRYLQVDQDAKNRMTTAGRNFVERWHDINFVSRLYENVFHLAIASKNSADMNFGSIAGLQH